MITNAISDEIPSLSSARGGIADQAVRRGVLHMGLSLAY